MDAVAVVIGVFALLIFGVPAIEWLTRPKKRKRRSHGKKKAH